MTITQTILLEGAARLGLFILTAAMALAVFRIIKGPKLADRIIALDLLSVIVVAMAALYAVLSEEKAVLDVAIAYALVAFLGTVAFARYLERSAGNRKPPIDSHRPKTRDDDIERRWT